MTSRFYSRVAVFAMSLLGLAACGGGGSDSPDSNGTTNRAPTANAGTEQSVDEQTNITLDGTGRSDPDGDNLTASAAV
jgi:predicted small lipoprotein YifL